MLTPELRLQERKKFDRHECYIYYHLGVLVMSLLCLRYPPAKQHVHYPIPASLFPMLEIPMAIGSASALIGILIGTAWIIPDLTVKPLDLRIPYGFAVGGLLGVGIGMWCHFYVSVSYNYFLGSFVGPISLVYGVMSVHLMWRFWRQIVVRTKLRSELQIQYATTEGDDSPDGPPS